MNVIQSEQLVIKSIIQFITKTSVLDLTLDEINKIQKETAEEDKLKERQRYYTREKLFNQFEKDELTKEELTKAMVALTNPNTIPHKKQKLMITKHSLEEILAQSPKMQAGTVPIEFYFNLVERVILDNDYQVKEIYLKSLNINILEQEEILL